MPDTDDADACHALAYAIKDRLEPLHQLGTNPEGIAIRSDLQLVEGTFSRALVDLARKALPSHPRCAMTLAGIAQDHSHARTINPQNSPTLYAVLASAYFQTGRLREAADALEILVSAYPELVALDETLGDLLALEATGRSGDSREP